MLKINAFQRFLMYLNRLMKILFHIYKTKSKQPI